MSKKDKKKQIILEKVMISDTANKGKSVAKHKEIVIFIDKAVPGDICDILVFKKRKKFWQARVVKTHHFSEIRSEPKCEHFGTCGGCKWQNMNYKYQLKFKEQEVLNNLSKIGGIKINNYNNIIGCDNQYLYRNKMEFTFSNKRWLTKEEISNKEEIIDKDSLGFHIPGMFDKVLDIKKCYLQKDPSNNIRLSIRKFTKKVNMPYFDIRKKQGLLRNLMIRTSSNNDLMVLIQFYKNDINNINLLMQHIKKSFPEISSLLYVINQKANNTIYDQEVICFHGKNYITEEIDGFKFRIGAKTFFQTNSKQTRILYQKTKELAKIKKEDIVYDLYTGTGTIAQYIAKDAKKVVGVDSVEEGIKSAYINAKINNISNCIFHSGDMKDILTEQFIKDNGKPNIIITDPPRDGMHKKVVTQIMHIRPKRIVYVSCNSSTQARDISLMKEDYRIKKIQSIDMFPQTHHVENIIVLEKK